MRRRRPVGLQLSPQRADVNLDQVVVVCVIAPHLGQQLVLGQGLSAVTHEKCEQSKLGRGQRELPTGAGGEPVFFIDEQPLDLQDLRDRASPAQHSPHARHQLLERKRLHQVIVGAQFESGDPVGHGVAGGEEDDRQLMLLRGATLPTQSRCRSAAAHRGSPDRARRASTSPGSGRSSNAVAVNRSARSAASTASRTGCSSSITTTRPIGSPIA